MQDLVPRVAKLLRDAARVVHLAPSGANAHLGRTALLWGSQAWTRHAQGLPDAGYLARAAKALAERAGLDRFHDGLVRVLGLPAEQPKQWPTDLRAYVDGLQGKVQPLVAVWRAKQKETASA